MFLRGNESAFAEALLACAPKARPLRYLEIGIAYGTTILAVAEWLRAVGIPADLHGVDMPNNPNPILDPDITVHLMGSAPFAAEYPAARWDYVFIDACHCLDCCTADFLAFENRVRRGGMVCFHDTSDDCQGKHKQCRPGGIQVKAALQGLGLLDGTRPGWRFWRKTEFDDGNYGATWFGRV